MLWPPPGGHFCTGYDLTKPITQAAPPPPLKWSKMSPRVHCNGFFFRMDPSQVVVKILVHLLHFQTSFPHSSKLHLFRNLQSLKYRNQKGKNEYFIDFSFYIPYSAPLICCLFYILMRLLQLLCPLVYILCKLVNTVASVHVYNKTILNEAY